MCTLALRATHPLQLYPALSGVLSKPCAAKVAVIPASTHQGNPWLLSEPDAQDD